MAERSEEPECWRMAAEFGAPILAHEAGAIIMPTEDQFL